MTHTQTIENSQYSAQRGGPPLFPRNTVRGERPWSGTDDSATRIFIVEDEAMILMEIKDRLENLGYEICGSASRGETAVERIAAQQPDLVLMDINLAGTMDGIETARLVRATCGAPVVFLTAYSDSALIARAAQVGAYGYLVKPFEERELYATIEVACERKHSESEIRELNVELENRVRERTANLEAANKELEMFNYSVAHDLRAPLRGIDGYSQLLLTDHAARLDDEGRGFLQNIIQATKHMGQLLDDLLAYARLERRDVEMAQVDPRALIESLLADRADEITARGVAVSVAVDCPSVRADREGLTMALRNLLENALKFTRDVPQPVIEIGGRDTGTTCILSVRDNGVGFDMKFHDRIFRIFQRLHRSEDYPGTGVGLALVKKAMERMGGRARAESEPGKGATFYLDIPK